MSVCVIIAVVMVVVGIIGGKQVVVVGVGIYTSTPANFKTTAMCGVITR